jgi:hypothetical protein
VERSGVELERCTAEFGTRFEHTFHVGVIDPADEEYVEVLASPVGDPGLDGFDEAPDGQTLRNLRITWELVDVPRVPVEPDEGVQPWAWYRGDDLDGSEGDPVSGWTDRTGNGRHLVPEPGRAVPSIVEGIDGTPGLGAGTQGTVSVLMAEYDPYTFTDGKTVVVVFSPGDNFYMAARGNRPGSWDLWQLVWGNGEPPWNGEQYLSTTGGGWVSAFDEGPKGPVAVVAAHGPMSVPAVWWNGQPLGQIDGDGASYQDSVWGQHELSTVNADEATVEWIVFDQTVDPDVTAVDFGPDGVQTLNGYLAGRYPSLFGGS